MSSEYQLHLIGIVLSEEKTTTTLELYVLNDKEDILLILDVLDLKDSRQFGSFSN